MPIKRSASSNMWLRKLMTTNCAFLQSTHLLSTTRNLHPRTDASPCIYMLGVCMDIILPGLCLDVVGNDRHVLEVQSGVDLIHKIQRCGLVVMQREDKCQ